jgi:hypothetical protein
MEQPRKCELSACARPAAEEPLVTSRKRLWLCEEHKTWAETPVTTPLPPRPI